MTSSISEHFSPPYPDVINLAAKENVNDDAELGKMTEGGLGIKYII